MRKLIVLLIAVISLLLAAPAAALAAITPPPGTTDNGITAHSTSDAAYFILSGVTSNTATWTAPAVPAGLPNGTVVCGVALSGHEIYTLSSVRLGTDFYQAFFNNGTSDVFLGDVRAGDVVKGTVLVAGTANGNCTYTGQLHDLTTGATVGGSATDSTVPWDAFVFVRVDEGSTFPLINFGTVNFTNCAWNGNPISSVDYSRFNLATSVGFASPTSEPWAAAAQASR